MGLYQAEQRWQEKSGTNFSVDEGDQSSENGNLLKKMLGVVKQIQKKVSSLKNMVTALSEIRSRMGEGLLLKGYMAYSLSNRMNYSSGSSLVGKSYSCMRRI